MRTIRVNAGYKNIEMPNGATYNGQVDVALSDDEYARLSANAFTSGMLTDLTAPSGASVSIAEYMLDAPAVALSQTTRRSNADASLSALTSGQLYLVGIPLRAGAVVTNIIFVSGTTGAATSTHCWFSLWSPARAKLGVTSDDTAASPWAGLTAKSLALASPVTITATGMHYLGVVVVATTVPQLRGCAATAIITQIAPSLIGTSDGSLTDPASAPSTAAAITAVSSYPYAYVT